MNTFFTEISSFQTYGEQSQISSLKSNDNNARSSFTQSLAYDPDRIAMTPYGKSSWLFEHRVLSVWVKNKFKILNNLVQL